MKAMSKSIFFFFCTAIFYAQAMNVNRPIIDLKMEKQLVQGNISIEAYLSAKSETPGYKNGGYSEAIKEI